MIQLRKNHLLKYHQPHPNYHQQVLRENGICHLLFYYHTILSNNVSGASCAEHFSGKSRKRCASEKASISAEILIMPQKKIRRRRRIKLKDSKYFSIG